MLVAWIVMGTAVAIAAVTGAQSRDARWFSGRGLLVLGIWIGLVVLTTVSAYDDQVSTHDKVVGTLLAIGMVGLLPFALYYGIGWALARHRVALMVVCVVSLVPLFAYFFIATLLVLGFVECPPGAYECPI